MSLDGDLYFAHSRVGKPGDPGYQEYKGQYPLITLKEKRRFTVLDLFHCANGVFCTKNSKKIWQMGRVETLEFVFCII
jgi:hypothetical protein